MRADNILVLAIDGLRASAIGAYGNTSYPTPALDELAAESFLLDACFADAIELPIIYRALWQGMHPLRSDASVESSASLPRFLRERGYATVLVTDDPLVASLPAAEGFDECVAIARETPVRAGEISQTAMAGFFSTVCEQLEHEPSSSSAARFVWVHARGFYGPWDAPLELQEPLLAREEGDPEPTDAVEPPDFLVDAGRGFDAAFRAQCAYAAQVIALDACIAAVLHAVIESRTSQSWLVVFCGVRGFPLGEHGRVGGIDDRMYAEQLHVPMLWRFPGGQGQLARDANLASHLELLPTIVDWIDRGTPPNLIEAANASSLLPRLAHFSAAQRPAAISASTSGALSIRTAEWSLRSEPRLAADVETAKAELFVRPDDRWEANDIAGLCPDVVDRLTTELERAVENWKHVESARSRS